MVQVEPIVKKKILVVDDEQVICDIVKMILNTLNYTVDSANDFQSAKALIDKVDYDIVVTDKNLPGTGDNLEGGMEVLEYTKRNNPSAEVVIMTGYASIDSAIDAIRLGAFDYIQKPFKIEELRDKLDHIIEYQTSIKPENILPVYKAFLAEINELINTNGSISEDDRMRLIESVSEKTRFFFDAFKERERIIFLQRDALDSISRLAGQLREKLPVNTPYYDLIESICSESEKHK